MPSVSKVQQCAGTNVWPIGVRRKESLCASTSRSDNNSSSSRGDTFFDRCAPSWARVAVAVCTPLDLISAWPAPNNLVDGQQPQAAVTDMQRQRTCSKQRANATVGQVQHAVDRIASMVDRIASMRNPSA